MVHIFKNVIVAMVEIEVTLGIRNEATHWILKLVVNRLYVGTPFFAAEVVYTIGQE